MQIKNVKVFGLEESIIASGYPMQTGESIDLDDIFDPVMSKLNNYLYAGIDESKDATRAKKLAKTPIGSGHNNFLKGIIVQFDMKYPQYLFSQLDRYNFWDDVSDGILPKTTDVMTIISSQSKMHKLTSIKDIENYCNGYVLWSIIDKLNELIACYNLDSYPVVLEDRLHKDDSETQVIATNKVDMFHYIISNLPMGYELWMRVSMNYSQIKTIWNQRCKHKHKLKDWEEFGDFVKTLPMAAELIYGD
jgi:hypothetical protein